MKILATLVTIALIGLQAAAAQSITVTTNVDRLDGMAIIKLYNSVDGWAKDEPIKVAAEILPAQAAAGVRSSSRRVVFIDLPPGQYAVGIHHDLNYDLRLNTDFFGKPVEPFGISNSPNLQRGKKPTFNEASFTLANQNLQLLVPFYGQ